MKRFLLIPDKFKGSLSASVVISTIHSGIKKVISNAEIENIWAADGGDGFLEAIQKYDAVSTIKTPTVNPLGQKIVAPYLFEENTKTAYIELAKASGIVLLKEPERNPLKTSTFGTGIQIKHAIELGAKHVFIGLGGSATNDGGCGIASALGYSFLNKNGSEIVPTGEDLNQIEQIKRTKTFDDVKFYAVNDVSNPLYGIKGAAYVYAQQKGANATEIALLDTNLRTLDKIVQKELDKSYALIPGSGAAGGTAYGLKTFFDAQFLSGIDFILRKAKVSKLLQKNTFDYIITGEGKIDSQTLNGKLISGVVEEGKKHKIPVVAFCGKLELSKKEYQQFGISEIIEIRQPNQNQKYNMDNASKLLEQSVSEFCSHLI